MSETTVTVEQKVKSVYWQPYVFANTQTRQFFCNAILFNNQGTGNVSINDIYILQPGDVLSLNCDQNEVDETMYKMNFVPGFSNKLAVMTKINQGSTAAVQKRLMSVTRPIDRKKQIKKYIDYRKRGDF